MTAATDRSDNRLCLTAKTAEDLMTENPVSINDQASVQEVIALFTDHHCHVAPVIDVAGRPVGVVSTTDVILHNREHPSHAPLDEGNRERTGPTQGKDGFSVEVVDPTLVQDVMTPFLITVTAQTPASKVVERLVSSKLHHLFVVDDVGTLVGVISSIDVLRHLHVERPFHAFYL